MRIVPHHLITCLLLLLSMQQSTGQQATAGPPPALSSQALAWGNAVYVNLQVGQSFQYQNTAIKLDSLTNNTATVSLNGQTRTLVVARQSLPEVVAGVRIFLADTRPVAELTTDEKFPLVHGALTGDALLCLSDAGRPLLDPERFTFPISRDDGFRWSMAENSHMFAYLRPARSHEGIDIDLTDARGNEIHALVAIEDGTVRWIHDGSPPETCLLLESASQPGLYYIYQHLNREKVLVQPGQKVHRGDKLAFIWGDGRWGHLHFSVVGGGGEPRYAERYRYLLNGFPQLVELWCGTPPIPTPSRTSASFRFADQYWNNGNTQYLGAWSDVLGYGWQLGDWCTAGKVETSLVDEGTGPFQGARLSKTMHRQTRHPARSPQDWIDFEVRVDNGSYRVRAEVGDHYAATWQRVQVEATDAGTFELPPGLLRWTGDQPVEVRDDRLTVRIHLRDDQTPAGLRNLVFEKLP
ncbi:MAG: M23 family metallopeptidase [Thermoguttaceae bacterium]